MDIKHYKALQQSRKSIGMSFEEVFRAKIDPYPIKVVLNYMLNDLFMNGSITWAIKTYADKSAISYRTATRYFNYFKHIGLISLEEQNKKSRKNKYYFDFHFFTALVSNRALSYSEYSKILNDTDDTTLASKHDTHDNTIVSPMTSLNDTDDKDNKPYIKSSIKEDLIKREEEDDFYESSSSTQKELTKEEKEDLEEFLRELDI